MRVVRHDNARAATATTGYWDGETGVAAQRTALRSHNKVSNTGKRVSTRKHGDGDGDDLAPATMSSTRRVIPAASKDTDRARKRFLGDNAAPAAEGGSGWGSDPPMFESTSWA